MIDPPYFQGLYDFFSRPIVLKIIILYNLYVARITRAVARYCEQGARKGLGRDGLLEESSSSNRRKQSDSSDEFDHYSTESTNDCETLEFPPFLNRDIDHKSNREKQQPSVYLRRIHDKSAYSSETKYEKTGTDSASEDQEEPEQQAEYEWKEFPKVHKFLIWWEYFGNLYMCYVIFKNTTPLEQALEYVIGPTEIPMRCYIPGRLSPKQRLSESLAVIFCMCHLAWRLTHFLTGTRPVSCLVFLLQSENDLDKYYAVLKKQADHPVDPKSNFDKLLRATMSYPTSYGMHKVYSVRPNRTKLARKRLIERLALSSLLTLVALGSLTAIICAYVIYDIIMDINYLRAWPHCSPELEEMLVKGQITSWSISLTWHKLISGLLDFLENVIIWLDSGLAVFTALPLAYLIDYDMWLCWEHLETRIKKIFFEMKQENLDGGAAVRIQSFDPLGDSSFFKYNSIIRPTTMKANQMTNRELEIQIHELQAKMADFFQQVRTGDTYISDVITVSTAVWIMGFCIYTYISVAAHLQNVHFSARLLLNGGLACITYNSFLLCALERRVHRSYRMLCSIVAHDRSRYKRKFLPVLDFFTLRKIPYTILRNHPYRLTTLLTVVGWTFSCMIILANLSRQLNIFKPIRFDTEI